MNYRESLDALDKAKKKVPEGQYAALIKCDNCDEYTIVTLPKGQTVYNYGTQTDCPNCGCRFTEEVL